MVGICKLCLKEKGLLKKSHIFPNFMYKGIGDEKNRMISHSSKTPLKKKTQQSGAYERHILCKECDNNILSNLERYANSNFYSKLYSKNDYFLIKNEGIECRKINYSLFKRFLDSLLWRASVTKHSLFENFKLQNDQEESLRKALVVGEPLSPNIFPCTILTPAEASLVRNDIVFINPFTPNKVSFYIGSFIYIFEFASNKFENHNLNENGELKIIRLPNKEWENIIKSLFNSYKQLSINSEA